MAKVVGDIAVEVSADIGPLQKALKRGGKDFQTFGDKAQTIARNVTRAGLAITAGVTAAGAGMLVMARNAAEAGAQIEVLSRVANTTPETFQKMAAAAKTVGIEQDKLADILKDVQDRVGDFLQTGGGPMADFFENIAPQVGVTAENFKNLGGPQALQLYVNSLQRANLSQDEMTFYMEAMASDLALLLPLLKDNGAEMGRIGDEAAAAGAIMSNEAVAGSADLRRELDQLGNILRNKVNEAILDNKDQIVFLADKFIEVLPKILKLAEGFATLAGYIGDGVKNLEALYRIASGNLKVPTVEELQGQNDLLDSARGADGPLNDILNRGQLPAPVDPNAPLFPSLGGDSIDGGQGTDTLGFVAGQNEMLFEIEQEHVDRMLGLLQDFRDQRFGILTQASEAELDLQRQHNESARQLEELSMDARLTMIRGALGDVSNLMASNNKKLFGIGKAAAIAEATVSGYQAAVDAWQKGMKVGGPPMAAAFTAASLARTGALISSIASTSIGGGSGAGAAGGGAAAGASAAPPPQPLYINANFTGEGPIPQRAMRDFLAQMNEAIEDGAVIRGFNLAG